MEAFETHVWASLARSGWGAWSALPPRNAPVEQLLSITTSFLALVPLRLLHGDYVVGFLVGIRFWIEIRLRRRRRRPVGAGLLSASSDGRRSRRRPAGDSKLAAAVTKI